MGPVAHSAGVTDPDQGHYDVPMCCDVTIRPPDMMGHARPHAESALQKELK